MRPLYQRKFWAGRDKQSYRCRNCGRTREEIEQVDVHHRQGHLEGDHPDNLLGLCQRCHLQDRHDRDADWLQERFDPPRPTGVRPPTPRHLGPSTA